MSVDKSQLSNEVHDLKKTLRVKESKIDELEWVLKNTTETHKAEGQALGIEMFQQMSALH